MKNRNKDTQKMWQRVRRYLSGCRGFQAHHRKTIACVIGDDRDLMQRVIDMIENGVNYRRAFMTVLVGTWPNEQF